MAAPGLPDTDSEVGLPSDDGGSMLILPSDDDGPTPKKRQKVAKTRATAAKVVKKACQRSEGCVEETRQEEGQTAISWPRTTSSDYVYPWPGVDARATSTGPAACSLAQHGRG